MVTSLGCEEEYGERINVVEDDQIGALTIREIEFGSLNELVQLAEEVDTIEVESTSWDKYDANITIIGEDGL